MPLKRYIAMKSYNRNENIKNNELVELKIDLKIFNKNNKVYKKKIIPLKILANLESTGRQ